jgi:hypothetical protein
MPMGTQVVVQLAIGPARGVFAVPRWGMVAS